jgi:hypothetical protein
MSATIDKFRSYPTLARRMGAQPGERLCGALVGRKDRVEDVLDAAAEQDQGQPPDQRHAGNLEGGEAKGPGEAQVGIAQHLERQMQPKGHLLLEGGGLRRQSEDLGI